MPRRSPSFTQSPSVLALDIHFPLSSFSAGSPGLRMGTGFMHLTPQVSWQHLCFPEHSQSELHCGFSDLRHWAGFLAGQAPILIASKEKLKMLGGYGLASFLDKDPHLRIIPVAHNFKEKYWADLRGKRRQAWSNKTCDQETSQTED